MTRLRRPAAEEPSAAVRVRVVLRRFLPQGRRLSDEVWRERHRGLTWLLWAHVPALFVFALVRHRPVGEAASQVGLLLLPASVALVPQLSRNIRSASTSVGLVAGASVLVHLAGGSTEAHFQFFVILAFLTLYQAWLPFLLALAYVVVEHGVIGALDPTAVYSDPSAIAHPWKYAVIHGSFVLAASTANLLSWRLTEHEALHDGLTGLPNRAFLLDALTATLSGRGRHHTAVLFVDLDNFKDVNDAFGHQVGDALLQALSRRLRGEIRPGDLLARLGGDEFAVVLSDLPDRACALAAAQRFLAALQEPLLLGDLPMSCSASVGIAFADRTTPSPGDLLRNADLAMYEAKRDGGNQVVEYRPVLHEVALNRVELEPQMRVALERGEFVLHHQPITDLVTGRLVGTEALVRWQHPTRGLIGPAEFISAAELSGLIIPLGTWVLRSACQQTAQWQRRQPERDPVTVAVNLSPRQLLDKDLVATVAQALHDSGLDASSLCLEITEGSVIKDFEATLPTLTALRTLGVSLALDDFGTGYSSLSYLKQLPVTSVKIDRSFVADLENDGPDARIVLATIDLAHALGMSVTAEGVETPGQLAALKAMRSDQAQGYLLGRPAPPEELADLPIAGSSLRVLPEPRGDGEPAAQAVP